MRDQRGFSLISTLIAAAVAGILAVVVVQLSVNAKKGVRHAELRGGLEDVRQVVRTRASCDITANACTGSTTYVDLKDKNGRTVWPGVGTATGAKVGDWNVRARCVTGGVELEQARLMADGSFARDPQNRTVRYRWAPLFAAGSNPCILDTSTVAGEPRGQYFVWKRFDTSSGAQIGGEFCVTKNTRTPSVGCGCPAPTRRGRTVYAEIVGSFGSLDCAFYHTANPSSLWNGEAGPQSGRTCLAETYACTER